MLSLATIFGKRPVVSVRNAAVGAALELISPVGADVNQYNILDRQTTVSISSSSADDDGAPAGTGALTVKIDGIDRTGAAVTETVTMNGQTAVVTTKTYMKVTAVTALTFGVGAANAGDLYVIRAGESTLTAGVPNATTNMLVKVPVGEGQAQTGIWTIPSNVQNTYYKIKSLEIGVRGGAGIVHVQVRPLSGTDATEVKRSEVIADFFTIGPVTLDLSHIPAIVGPADIELRALSAGATIMTAKMVLERQS